MSVDCSDPEQWEDYGENTEACCKTMKDYGVQALGCDVLINIIDDINVLNTSNLLFENLKRLNKYMSFTFKKTTQVDTKGWCQHQGWKQGFKDSDCFLDATFFALFGNNDLSVLFSSILDELYESSTDDSNLKKVIYCISVYTELLSRSRPQKFIQLNTNDITININSTDITYDFKQATKWCLLYYMCQYIKEKFTIDSIQYKDIVESGLSTSIKKKKTI
jgi:hypothetical protein